MHRLRTDSHRFFGSHTDLSRRNHLYYLPLVAQLWVLAGVAPTLPEAAALMAENPAEANRWARHLHYQDNLQRRVQEILVANHQALLTANDTPLGQAWEAMVEPEVPWAARDGVPVDVVAAEAALETLLTDPAHQPTLEAFYSIYTPGEDWETLEEIGQLSRLGPWVEASSALEEAHPELVPEGMVADGELLVPPTIQATVAEMELLRQRVELTGDPHRLASTYYGFELDIPDVPPSRGRPGRFASSKS